MILAFLIQFFNTGPLLILINADLSQVGIPLFSSIKQGFHADFTVRWYKDVGKVIIDAMTANILAPVIECGIALATRVFF